MHIEHIAMYVNDIESTKDFFVKYFNATANKGYHNQTTNFRSYFLSFDDGARLEIMNKPIMEDVEKTLIRTGYIHIAFSLGSKEAVNELTERLKNDGFHIISGPRTTGDGYYESCIIGIEGNQIELTE
ncbi:MAG: VOC family protein [Lachnospiraceae bacterium]|nr:VOC family protein [Lachnospiraceae bacterium]